VVEGVRHGRGACGAYADSSRGGRSCFHPSSHARQQRTIAERDQGEIERMRPASQLDGDRSGALCDGGFAAIFDEERAGFRRKRSRVLFGFIEIPAGQADVGVEFAHTVKLQGIGCFRGEDYEGKVPLSGCVGHSLTEVAGGGADQLLAGGSACPTSKTGEKEIGASSFERADGIYGFYFENHPEGFACKLGAVQENRIDGTGGGFNSIQM
jgi:hypothetical protein